MKVVHTYEYESTAPLLWKRMKSNKNGYSSTHAVSVPKVSDTEGPAIGAEELTVVRAAPIAKSGVSAMMSLMLPMFTAWRL